MVVRDGGTEWYLGGREGGSDVLAKTLTSANVSSALCFNMAMRVDCCSTLDLSRASDHTP